METTHISIFLTMSLLLSETIRLLFAKSLFFNLKLFLISRVNPCDI